MKRDINRYIQGQYDLLVIGGGINGAAVAYMAALNGIKTALLEKGDFASGTSSKSTKLVHGGLRYLESFEFALVKESLRERFLQLRSLPHLVKPLQFIIPVYKDDQRPLWLMRLGVSIYDLLCGKYSIGKHQVLTVEQVTQFVPGIKKEGLLGGVMYYDSQMDDARVCLENVLSADERGAHVANYVEVKSLINEIGKTVGVKAYDHISQREFELRAKKIVCAAGPWTDLIMRKERSQAPPKVRTTKGVHLLYRQRVSEKALFVQSKKDGRMIFIVPFMGSSLIGTTDTDYYGNPDDVKTDEEDISYLFGEAGRILPYITFRKDDIVTTFAGLRPLVAHEGSPSKVSRKHSIEESYTGITYVLGGKYTTYRKIAEDVLQKISKKKLISTKDQYPLYGSGTIEENAKDVAQKYDLGVDVIQSLMSTYGTRYKDVLELVKKDETLKQRIFPDQPLIRAQMAYAVSKEMAIKPEDIINRRLSLKFLDVDKAHVNKIVQEFIP